jgi:AraC-like DNA-binding protein
VFDLPHFIHHFRRAVGATPAAFARGCRAAAA